jgi:alanyl aminopeptidase
MNARRILASLLILAAAGCGSARTKHVEPPPLPSPASLPPPPPDPPKLRLGDGARPRHYALEMTIAPSEDEFTAAIEIELELRDPKTLLWLNGTDLDIRTTSIRSGADSIGAHSIPGDGDFVGIAFERSVPAGLATLRIEYAGKLSRRNSNGLFKQKEGDDWYVFSHFEPIDARRAFPCFDEPEFKVPWQLTLHVRKDDAAVANAPEISETMDDHGMKTVKFAETRPLPSYLIALAVGPFEFVAAGKTALRGAPIRIIAPRGRAREARYAAKTTRRVVAALEDYFGSPYPYEKLDQIAVLQSGGAMENPGLVTYSQLLILMKAAEETPSQKRRFASVCAHELAHQWFGDLVTMKWWNDTWLNEAFATWLGDKIVNRLWPQWKHRLSTVQSRSDIMSGDGLMSARRIRQPIESNHDISNAFDLITYSKGGAVLSMFESWIGVETFRRGVQRYLKEHAWGNATAEDFLAAVSAESERDVATPFSTFLDQAGVPVVTVSLECATGKNPQLRLAQQRYLPLGSSGSPRQLWQIPVCVRYGAGASEHRQCMLLTAASAEMALEAQSCPDWVLGNDAATGYYRVALEGHLLPKLLAGRVGALSEADRLALFGDIQAAVRSGKMPAGDALSLVPGLVLDGNRHLIGAVAAFLAGGNTPRSRTSSLTFSIGEYLVPDSERASFARFIRQTLGGKARALGWKARQGEDDETRLLRPVLVSLVADVGEDKALIAAARELTDRWLRNRNAIDLEMVEPVMRSAAAHGDQALFVRLHEEAKKEPRLRERGHLLRAMAAFREPRIIESALKVVLSGEFDSRETMAMLFGEHMDPATALLTYDFVRENFDALAAKLPRDTPARLPAVAMGLCDDARSAEVEQFFAGRSTRYTGGPRILSQALEQLSLCSAYRRDQQPSVAAFLRNYRPRTLARPSISGPEPNTGAEAAEPR